MAYDPQRHHRRSIRLRDYQYDTAGGYAVTVCTAQKEQIFGSIRGGMMRLNESGRAVEAEWLNLTTRYPSIMLDEFMLMPNHLHGIIFLSPELIMPIKPFPTLGTVIGAFKSLSARAVGQQSGDKSCRIWQRNYYEQIIRSGTMLDAIRLYIAHNPAHWQDDPENADRCRAQGLPQPS